MGQGYVPLAHRPYRRFMSEPDASGRGRLARLDDAVFGSPGGKGGFYGNLALGLHPWLAPLYMLVALAGLGLIVFAVVEQQVGPAVLGTLCLTGGSAYAWASLPARAKKR
jgi:hypothetical protein